MIKRRASIVSAFLCLSFFVALNQSVFAGYFLLSPSSKSVNAGESFTVNVDINPGSDQLFGVQAFVLYNKDILEAVSVSQGSYFPTVTKNIVAGKVYISGDTEIGTPVSGTGTLATITFKALKSGTDTVRFLCDLNSNDTSIIGKNDASSTNVIECSQNGTMAVTVAGTSGGNNPAPTATPVPSNSGGSNSGGSNSGGSTSSSGSTQTPTELPKSGVADHLGIMSIAGFAFILLGGAARLVFKYS